MFFKSLLRFLAKGALIFFGVISFALLIIVLIRPEWIKEAIRWIEALIQDLGNWNYLIAFASAFIESLPSIGSLVPGMNVMILVGGIWGKTHIIGTILAAILGAMLGNYL